MFRFCLSSPLSHQIESCFQELYHGLLNDELKSNDFLSSSTQHNTSDQCIINHLEPTHCPVFHYLRVKGTRKVGQRCPNRRIPIGVFNQPPVLTCLLHFTKVAVNLVVEKHADISLFRSGNDVEGGGATIRCIALHGKFQICPS